MRKFLLAFFLAAVFVLSGCGAGFPFDEEEAAEVDYSRPQIMMIVTTERNRYEEVYTEAIWDVVLESGETFEAYLLGQIREFMQNLKIVNLLADKREMVLTSTEKDRLQTVADRYFDGLSEEEVSYMGLTRKEALALYQEYYRANKLVEELTSQVDLEVSDSEAKVITVRMIRMSDQKKAEETLERVSREGSDFAAVARETSEGDEVEFQLGRGETDQAVEAAAFALAVGEISPLIESGGQYYIIQCVNDYDAAATALRKTRLYEERKNQLFRQIYSQFEMGNMPAFSDEVWSDLYFASGDPRPQVNFFELYQEAFGD